MWSSLLPAPRLGALFALAFLALEGGCSDDPADPIVLAGDAPQNAAGSGPGGTDDPGDLCTPCGSRVDCAAGESCVEIDRNSDRFCSRSCGDATSDPADPSRRCPTGYVCAEVYNLSSPACVPDSGQCTSVIP